MKLDDDQSPPSRELLGLEHGYAVVGGSTLSLEPTALEGLEEHCCRSLNCCWI